MSITIEINENQLKNDAKLKLHYLPAKINGDGVANVDNYFNNYTQTDETTGCLKNALRGFPLYGEKQKIPAEYKALVLQETTISASERKLKVTGCFDEFTYWNYDKVPTKADAYKMALQSIDMTDELAKPITEEDVQKEIERRKQHLATK